MAWQSSVQVGPTRPAHGLLAQGLLPFSSSLEPVAQPEPFSELSLSGNARHCELLLASMLRQLADGAESRWLTLIAPPTPLGQRWLREQGLNRERILVLQPRAGRTAQELACQALSAGCSHTVVTWFEEVDAVTRSRLQAAARTGQAQVVNIRFGR